MFGGTAFLVNGNMASGVHGDKLIVRLGVEAATSAMADPVVQPFDLSGRPMKGWITVGPEGCQTDEQLGDWIKQGLAYACSLPAK
jgi:hypothetical protein